MEQRYEKFRTSGQAAVKLRIASEDFFREELPETLRRAYGAYLRQRIRPAVELLIREEQTEKLEALWNLGWIPAGQLGDFLHLAAEVHKNEAFLWLLEKKQSSLGFPPRDFSL